MLQRVDFEQQGSIATAQIRIGVVGIKPLLAHNPESMGSGPDAKKGTRIPEKEVEAEAGTYRLPDGSCAIKGEAFRGCALGAGGAWKTKGRSTMKARLAHILVVEELVPLLHPDGTPIRDYVIDARRARVQRAGIIRHRPRFDNWRCEFTIEYDPKIIPQPEVIAEIMNDGGNRVGVGDYRPACNGFFGRFRVTEYWL